MLLIVQDVEERGAAGEAVALLFSLAELFKMERGESGDDLSGVHRQRSCWRWVSSCRFSPNLLA